MAENENKNIKIPRNEIAIAGFICALVALCLCWVPGLNWCAWAAGVVLSAVGYFMADQGYGPLGKGYAAAGLIISLCSLVALILCNFAFIRMAW